MNPTILALRAEIKKLKALEDRHLEYSQSPNFCPSDQKEMKRVSQALRLGRLVHQFVIIRLK